jgi:hypothetical protein
MQPSYPQLFIKEAIVSTLIIEHCKINELPPQWAQRLNASADQTVTVRIETESTGNEATFVTNDPAFGIWRDREDTADVNQYLRALRAPRHF